MQLWITDTKCDVTVKTSFMYQCMGFEDLFGNILCKSAHGSSDFHNEWRCLSPFKPDWGIQVSKWGIQVQDQNPGICQSLQDTTQVLQARVETWGNLEIQSSILRLHFCNLSAKNDYSMVLDLKLFQALWLLHKELTYTYMEHTYCRRLDTMCAMLATLNNKITEKYVKLSACWLKLVIINQFVTISRNSHISHLTEQLLKPMWKDNY